MPAGPPAAADTPAAALLRIDAVHKRFGGLQALDGVSLAVRRGEIFGLIGPNGSGKTTLINVVSGIYRADRGSVALDGAELGGRPSSAIARSGIARTFQNINLVDEMTVLDNVAVARHGFERAGLRQALLAPWSDPAWRRAREHAMGLLDAMGVAHVAAQPAGGLAYGLKRRVELARALALQPRLLLLDEPAAGLNEAEQDDLAARLKTFAGGGMAVLLIEHNMPFLMPLAERIACLDRGRVIAEGTPDEIRRDPQVIAAYLGEPSPPRAR